ncbi:MAG: hypothetical protein ACM3US_00465 [Sphingomonadaceae bacterium]
MATCPDCGSDVPQEATTTCTREHFDLAGRPVPRIRYGEERRARTWYEYEGRCDDCGVVVGGYHHRDCAIEQCPLCGDYAAVCRCWEYLR